MNDSLDLSSYLLAPIQRLGKYILLLKGINEQLNKNYCYSTTVQAALDMVKKMMSKANDYIAIDSIKRCPIDLERKAGSFIMREKFLMIRADKLLQNDESVVFFFDEIIVFTVQPCVSIPYFKRGILISSTFPTFCEISTTPVTQRMTWTTTPVTLGMTLGLRR